MGVSVRRWKSVLLSAAFVLLALPGFAWAQAGTATVTGTVKDTQGAVLPGATVTITNVANGAVRSAVTNQSGSYSMPGLPPGEYVMKFELSSFSPFVREKVILRVDTTTQVDAPLAIGGVNETITVTESTPIINTTDASVGNTLSRETIARLPVEARNVVHLLSLQPGAVFIPNHESGHRGPEVRLRRWRALGPAERHARRR